MQTSRKGVRERPHEIRCLRRTLLVLGALLFTLLATPAFGQTPSNPIDRSRYFVWQIYIDVLRRSPEDGGLWAWADYVDGCSVDDSACTQQHRLTTAKGFLASSEFVNNFLCQQNGVCTLRDEPPDTEPYNQEYVRQLYLAFLHREPDQGGWDAWLQFINTHPGDYDTLVSGFINSGEYRQRFALPDEAIQYASYDWEWSDADNAWYAYPPLSSPDSRIVDAWCDPAMCYYEEEYSTGTPAAGKSSDTVSPECWVCGGLGPGEEEASSTRSTRV